MTASPTGRSERRPSDGDSNTAWPFGKTASAWPTAQKRIGLLAPVLIRLAYEQDAAKPASNPTVS